MTSKERVLATFEFMEPDRVPSWLGASPEFISKAINELGLKDEEELLQVLGDDFRRVIAPFRPENPVENGNSPFNIPKEGIGYGIAMNNPLNGAGIDEIAG